MKHEEYLTYVGTPQEVVFESLVDDFLAVLKSRNLGNELTKIQLYRYGISSDQQSRSTIMAFMSALIQAEKHNLI